jgi:hypothetical protein
VKQPHHTEIYNIQESLTCISFMLFYMRQIVTAIVYSFHSWVSDVLMWCSSLEMLTTVMSCADWKNINSYMKRNVSKCGTLRP